MIEMQHHRDSNLRGQHTVIFNWHVAADQGPDIQTNNKKDNVVSLSVACIDKGPGNPE